MIKINRICGGAGGFTLVEVMVATFLSVVTTVSAFFLLSQSSRTLRSCAARVEALQDARTAMEYLRTLQIDSDELVPGTHTAVLNGMACTYEVQLVSGSSELRSVEVSVNWTSPFKGQQRAVELFGLFASPLHQGGAAIVADGHSNNGHGNNADGVDTSNPGNSKEGEDSDPGVDDEIGKRAGGSGSGRGNGNGNTDDLDGWGKWW